MKTITICAQFECLVQKNGETLGFLESEMQELKISENSDFVLTFFPTNNFDSLPYSCKVCAVDGAVSVNTKNCAIIKMPYDNYELVFFPYKMMTQKSIIESSQIINSPFASYEVKIIREVGAFSGSQILEIWDKNNKVFTYQLASVVEDCLITSKYINNELFIVVNGIVEDYQYCLLVSVNNTQVDASLELLSHKIEIGDAEIKALTKCFDINKHGKVYVYAIENGKIFKKDEYLVSIKENTRVVPEVVPFAFFESLKLGDLKLCRSYLTEALSNSIDDEHLKAYFGNFIEVKPNNLNDLTAVILVYENGTNYIGKLCKVEMLNDKIDNFELCD